MYTKTPYLLRFLFPNLMWDIKTKKKEIYLTFDDGPNPLVTPKVLDILDQYNARATFFCVGKNVNKYPDTYQRILQKGHKTGNHTYNHLKGWKTPNSDYYDSIEKCAALVDSHLFRPPHGQIKPVHIPHLKKQYKIIMWSVLTKDYLLKESPEKCLKNSIQSTRPGSIVVFHDSNKAAEKMFYILPRYLEYFSKKGFSFPEISI